MLSVEWPLSRAPIEEGSTEWTEPVSDHLDELKQRVPHIINEYGRKRWDAVVTATTTRAAIPAPEKVVSRAFYKMREILMSCALPRATRSLHLGEAPGGFIQAVAQHADASWTWSAVSLCIDGAPIPSHHLPASGAFMKLPHGGDILRCADEVVALAGENDLVTADGAVAMNHDCLEKEHLGLVIAQTNVALRCLTNGGTFVCKFFEGNLGETRAWLAQLTTRFECVSIIKPTWSRPTNSERYVVCRGFTGPSGELVTCRVAGGWLQDASRILDRMRADQVRALKRAIHHVSDGRSEGST